MKGLTNYNANKRMRQLLALIILILIGILFVMTTHSKQDTEGNVKTDQLIPRQGKV
ncbi:MAG: hypothetical protein JNM78_18590 [Cyclobacteriaceae bacterium]|nr:hypothetical protein [Cyclobacteriaceae bacterium]